MTRSDAEQRVIEAARAFVPILKRAEAETRNLLPKGDGYAEAMALVSTVDALSALTAAGYVVEPGWQDIATAPGDAVEIDIWVTRSSDGHDYSEGGYRQERVVWNSVDEYWEGDCVAVFPQQVSHWRPLPAPPAQEPQP